MAIRFEQWEEEFQRGLRSGIVRDHVRQLFDQIAGFPNVTGCVDGTHIRIIAASAKLYGRQTLHTPF